MTQAETIDGRTPLRPKPAAQLRGRHAGGYPFPPFQGSGAALAWRRQGLEGERPHRDIRVGPAGLCADIRGAGKPLILVHGLGGSSRWWARNMPALARSFRVHAVDLPGFGRSRGQRFMLREAAGLLVRWMGQLGLDRASLVGHSMGGFIAAHVAAQFPARVERLVLVDAAALPLGPFCLRQALGMVRGLRRMSLAFLPIALTDALRAGPVTIGTALRDLCSADITAELARIEAPTLVLWGEHDAVLPVAIGQRLHGYLPQATFRVIAGAGHTPMWERPDVFNQAVTEFLW
jgi:pimeloyl-ACP methyl ester carboxylesterase